MIHREYKDELIRTVPIKTPKKTKIITTRFTKEEKEKIDDFVKKYGTTITDFTRNAIFFYINELENINYKIKEKKSEPIEPIQKNLEELSNLKRSIKIVEDQLKRLEEKTNTLGVSNRILGKLLKS